MFAEPITDPGSVKTSNPYETSLVDGTGLPFLLTGAPTYFGLPGGNTDGGDGSGEGSSGDTSSFGNPLFSSLFNDPSNGGGGGDSSNNLPNLLGTDVNRSDEYGPNDVPGVPDDFRDPQVPEPATLLLIGAGLTAAAVRRRARANGTV